MLESYPGHDQTAGDKRRTQTAAEGLEYGCSPQRWLGKALHTSPSVLVWCCAMLFEPGGTPAFHRCSEACRSFAAQASERLVGWHSQLWLLQLWYHCCRSLASGPQCFKAVLHSPELKSCRRQQSPLYRPKQDSLIQPQVRMLQCLIGTLCPQEMLLSCIQPRREQIRQQYHNIHQGIVCDNWSSVGWGMPFI